MKGRFLDELRGWFSGLRDLFFQRDCIVCGGALDPGGRFVCPECLADMPLTYFWTYSENAMMERLGGFAGENGEAEDSGVATVRGVAVDSGGTAAGEFLVESYVAEDGGGTGKTIPDSVPSGDGCHVYNAAALFFYRHESPWCEIVRQFKYGRRESLGLWAARLLGDYLAEGGLYGDIQAVVPVPLHWFKRWKRGFNQAEVIARGVAERLGGGKPNRKQTGDKKNTSEAVPVNTSEVSSPIESLAGRSASLTRSLPVETRLLRRVRYTFTQTRRGASSRRQNIRGAFALNPKAVARLKASGVRHILLVDDVLTTGATLSECIRLLQHDFTVSVATLGFVE